MIHSEYTLQDQPSIALVQAISTLTSELQNMKNQAAVIQQRNDGPSQRHLMGQAAHLKNLEGGQQGVAYNRQSGYMGGNRNNNQGGSQQGLNRSGTRYNPGQCGFCGILGHFKDDCKKLACLRELAIRVMKWDTCLIIVRMPTPKRTKGAQVSSREVRYATCVTKWATDPTTVHKKIIKGTRLANL